MELYSVRTMTGSVNKIRLPKILEFSGIHLNYGLNFMPLIFM